jgi:predicted MFS family arabinose efflux permease
MTELRRLLRLADFRRLWLAQLISDVGDSLTILSLLFLVQRLTGDEAAVASVLLVEALPALVVGLVAGVWADRWNLKRTMIGSDLIRAALVLALLLVDADDDIWFLFVVVFLHASVGTFFRPARMKLLPRIVTGEQLLAANSVNEATRVIGFAVGTALAGLLVGVTGVFAPVFLADAATFVLSAGLVARIATPGDREPSHLADTAGVRAELAQGLGLMIRSRWLRGVLVGATLAMVGLGAVNGLLVPFVLGELGHSETWFGLLEVAQAGGVVLASAVVSSVATRLRPGTLLGGGLVALGVVVGAFALSSSILSLVALLLFVGLTVGPVQSSVVTILQTEAPPALLGRAASAMSASSTAAQVASLALAAGLASWVGVRSVFIIAGGVVVLAGIGSLLLFRSATAARPMAASSSG